MRSMELRKMQFKLKHVSDEQKEQMKEHVGSWRGAPGPWAVAARSPDFSFLHLSLFA